MIYVIFLKFDETFGGFEYLFNNALELLSLLLVLFGNGVLNKIKNKNKKKFIQVNIITYSHVEHLEGG